MNNVEFYCQSCNANWTKESYTPGCEECGEGALTRHCIICDGKCGNTFDRAPLDSNDSGMAHWIGSCGLPKVEQLEIIRRKVKEKNI